MTGEDPGLKARMASPDLGDVQAPGSGRHPVGIPASLEIGRIDRSAHRSGTVGAAARFGRDRRHERMSPGRRDDRTGAAGGVSRLGNKVA